MKILLAHLECSIDGLECSFVQAVNVNATVHFKVNSLVWLEEHFKIQDSRFCLFAFLPNIQVIDRHFNVWRGDHWKPPGLGCSKGG